MANTILNDPKLREAQITAYADDFAFVFFGKRRIDIEQKARQTLTHFCQRISDLGRELSVDKSGELTLNFPTQLKLAPIIKINGKSVRYVQSLRYLGVTLDRCLNWLPHINAVKHELARMHNNVQKLAPKTWGISTSLQRVWYQTIFERIILYGVGVWDRGLFKNYIQRPFLLQISRGYRTVSTDALTVITCLAPIKEMIQMENIKACALGLGSIEVQINGLGV